MTTQTNSHRKAPKKKALTRAITAIGVIVIVAAVASVYVSNRAKNQQQWQALEVEEGAFKVTVPATASVQPENKIVVMPPVPGRVDQILLDEGAEVEEGQILAWMSSTDRAALLDAARTQGKSAEHEWANVYKPTPILSPVKGRIIARNIVNGQTIAQGTSLFEISDRLVIRAQVDETDIGKISVGQTAEVKVDAYPDKTVSAKVARIGHQSVLTNNVNMYEVLLAPEEVPAELRSGMTATVNFILFTKEKSPLLPAWVAGGKQNSTIELTVRNREGQPETRQVRVGYSNGSKVEVLENLAAKDTVLYLPVKLNGDQAGMPFSFLGGKKKN